MSRSNREGTPVFKRNTFEGSRKRRRLSCHARGARVSLALILTSLFLVACGRLAPPVATAVNPETFPQVVPPPITPLPSELPPPVTENRAFVTIDGIPQYRIGPGDFLEVFLTKGPTQDRFLAPVRGNGRIAVSFVDVRVDGLTADQAALELTRELSVYFRNPVVEVQVKEYNSKRVSVLGAVGSVARGAIGAVSLTGRTTLLEVIAKAGGLTPSASIERVRITREPGRAYTVNMYRYVQEGDISQDFIMDAGDAVFVPERVPGEERRVFLLGEVKTPGPVPWFPTFTLSQLIAHVGGWNDGALFEEARIIRPDLQNPEIIAVDLGRLLLDGDRRIDQFLRPNDIIYIPRTRIANWNAFLAQLRPTLEFISIPFQDVLLFKAVQREFK